MHGTRRAPDVYTVALAGAAAARYPAPIHRPQPAVRRKSAPLRRPPLLPGAAGPGHNRPNTDPRAGCPPGARVLSGVLMKLHGLAALLIAASPLALSACATTGAGRSSQHGHDRLEEGDHNLPGMQQQADRVRGRVLHLP